MMNMLMIALALLVGLAVGYLARKRSTAQAEQRISELTNQAMEAAATKAALTKEVDLLKQQITDEQQRAAADLNRQKEDFSAQFSKQEVRFKETEEARRAEFKQQLEQQLELVKTQLKQQTEQSNRESISEIMRPYREQLEQLKQQNVEDRATLQNEIKRFVETGGRLTREADRLVTALSSSVTIQGNLGEKLLRDILAGSGLVEGVQYKLQHTILNEDGTTSKNSGGKKMRPDAMLIYPEQSSVLYIDSKFQLPSELDFNNLAAEDQKAVLGAFAKQIEDQARKLSGRDYDRSNNEGLVPLPYVIMFVPSETALAAVTSFDRTLWQRVFTDYRVCLASERNLLVLIEMVREMWARQAIINGHEQIIAQAQVLMDRVVDFMSEFDTVESSLSKAVKATEEMRRLSNESGRSIPKAMQNLSKLGVKPGKVSNNDRPAKLNKLIREANLPEADEEAVIEAVNEQ